MFLTFRGLFSIVLISLLGITSLAFSQADNSNLPSSDNSINNNKTATEQSGARKSPELKKSAADLALEALPSADSYLKIEDPVAAAIENEKYCLRYFEEGVKFWIAFPNDQRKYRLLENLIWVSRPKFWENPQEAARLQKDNEGYYSSTVNRERLKQWQDTIAKYKGMFLDDPRIDINTKQMFCNHEIRGITAAAANSDYWEGKENFLFQLRRSFDKAIEMMGAEENSNTRTFLYSINNLFVESTSLGLDVSDLRNFVTPYLDTQSPVVKKWVTQKLNLLDANLSDFFLHIPSAKGLEMEKLKGKVVLLDFWNIYCTTCISRMPILKSIYEKYNSQGFEVVSVSVDHEEDRKKVDEIGRKFGGNWEHLIIGGKNDAEHKSATADWKRLFNYYGFSGVPQILVFDQKGELAMVDGVLVFGDPEPAIENLLRK